MSNIIRPTTGTIEATYTSCASGSELSSIGASYGVLCGVLFDNSGGGNSPDTFADVSFSGTGTTPSNGTCSLPVLIYPLNQDGTTYGPNDMTPGSAAAALTPNFGYQGGTIWLAYGKSSATIVGCTLTPMLLPFAKFYVGLFNPLSNTITSATLKIKTWSYTVNG